MLPPGVLGSWDACGPIAQAELLAYDNIRRIEDIPEVGT